MIKISEFLLIANTKSPFEAKPIDFSAELSVQNNV